MARISNDDIYNLIKSPSYQISTHNVVSTSPQSVLYELVDSDAPSNSVRIEFKNECMILAKYTDMHYDYMSKIRRKSKADRQTVRRFQELLRTKTAAIENQKTK